MSKSNITLIFILAAFVILATSWNIIIPPYENLDELEHAEVIRHIVVTGKLPVHSEAEAGGFLVRQEASQPPLYHLTAALWVKIWNLPKNSHTPEAEPENLIACGSMETFYNKATWKHDPRKENYPWTNSILTLHALRLFSTLLQIATITGVWTLAGRIFTNKAVPVLAVILVAFNPQFLLISAGVNNDNIINPIATWSLVLIYDVWQREFRISRNLILGVLCGLAALSKLSGIGLLGLAGMVIIIKAWRYKIPVKILVLQIVLLLVPFIVLFSPWIFRNIQLYNDPTALVPMLEKVGNRQTSSAFGEFRLMFLSYWGQLPCSFYPRALYWPYIILVIGGLMGLLLGWSKYNTKQKYMVLLCGVWFLLIVIAWVRWNSLTYATGGRLLFPAMPGLALLLASGWWVLIRRYIRMWSALLPVWALLTLLLGPAYIFSPPRVVRSIDPDAQSSSIYFGDSIILEGYNVDIHKAGLHCYLASRSYCNPILDLSLYWQTNHQIMRDDIVVIQLVAAESGNTTLRFNYNHWPGKGNYPCSTWRSGNLVRDRYLLPLPVENTPTSAWKTQIAFINSETGQRLPVVINGQLVGDAAYLDVLRVPGIILDYPNWGNPATPVNFNNAITLNDAQLISLGKQGLEVQLFWECKKQVSEDYTVFVHGYDIDGNLVVTGDSPPDNGGFPTSLWQSGDRIMDTHILQVNESSIASITIGLYQPLSGDRLHAEGAEGPLPNNAVIIWSTVAR